jgi:hypothetical protein
MANIGVLVGTGTVGGDAPYKSPWIRHLAKSNAIYIISTISPTVHLQDPLKRYHGEERFNIILESFNDLQAHSTQFKSIYDDKSLHIVASAKQIEELQRWLGISFSYLASLSREFFDLDTLTESRESTELTQFVFSLVNIFREFFEKNKIDVYINTLEDTTISVVAYYTAKRLGVRTIGLVPGRFPKTGLMLCEDFQKICKWNSEIGNWNEILSQYDTYTITNPEIADESAKRWNLWSIAGKGGTILEWVYYNKYRQYILNTYPHANMEMHKISILSSIFDYITETIRIPIIRKFFKPPCWEDNYFFFPMHYNADAQMTFREPFTVQTKIIEVISRSLPTGYYLYVKPHPHYLGSDVAVSDIKSISRLTNVKIIDPSVLPMDLIKNSKAVITINSTTGLEALINGTPVISLGHDFYCDPKYAYIVRDLNELPEIIMAAIKGNSHEKEEIIKLFVKMAYSNTIWIDTPYNKRGYWTMSDDSGKKVADAINNIL